MNWLTRLYLRTVIDLKVLASREDGQTFTEYALIIGFIVAVVIGVVVLFGETLADFFQSILCIFTGDC